MARKRKGWAWLRGKDNFTFKSNILPDNLVEKKGQKLFSLWLLYYTVRWNLACKGLFFLLIHTCNSTSLKTGKVSQSVYIN